MSLVGAKARQTKQEGLGTKWFRPHIWDPLAVWPWVMSLHLFELARSHRTTWSSHFAVADKLRADVELSSQLQSAPQ